MRGSEFYEVEIYCKNIVRECADLLRWEWDEKFQTVIAQFSKNVKGEILPVLRRHFMYNWSPKTIKKASGTVLQFVEALGGVRGDQRLFMSDPEMDLFLFAAWWPWGDGATVSLRVGAVASDITDEEESLLKKGFRGWFGV